MKRTMNDSNVESERRGRYTRHSSFGALGCLAAMGLGLLPLTLGACGSDVGETRENIATERQALEPMDLIPPTSYTVTLLVRPPPGTAWSDTVWNVDTNSWEQLNYNYSPWAGATWNVMGSLGVQVGANNWNTQSCMFGDLATISPSASSSPCSATTFQGTQANQLAFGAASAPLQQTFTVTDEAEVVSLGIALDNIGQQSGLSATQSNLVAAFAQGTTTFGNGVQAVGNAIQVGVAESNAAARAAAKVGVTLEGAGTALELTGTYLAAAGAVLSAIGALLQYAQPGGGLTIPPICLNGMIGNPLPVSSKPRPIWAVKPLDAATLSLTAKQLYEGTANGPMTLTIKPRVSYSVGNFASWGSELLCRAATDISFIIDRVASWGDGLAFQPRSADSAVVRRRNAVESFRVNPLRGQIEHDSWQYTPYEDPLNPVDGLAQCNGPSACSPLFLRSNDATNNIGANDPPPAIWNPGTPITALSPTLDRVDLFFVDDAGSLYRSAGTIGNFNPYTGVRDSITDASTWTTVLLARGLPANAHVAAIHRGRNNGIPGYTLFWIGTDGAITMAFVGSGPGFGLLFANDISAPTKLTGAIATPGGSIAAVARRPSVGDVFAAGAGGIWHLAGSPESAQGWSVALIGPSSGQVAEQTAVTAVATTTDNLDVFYFNQSRALEHVLWTTQYATDRWTYDGSLTSNVASQGVLLQLSSVSRTPNNIDVVFPCDSSGICDVSIDQANYYTGIVTGKTPAIALGSPPPNGPLSIVAPSSLAVDVVSVSNEYFWGIPVSYAYDHSWQVGAQGWANSGPPTYYQISMSGAIQSSTYGRTNTSDLKQNTAERAIDGNTDGNYFNDSVTHTDGGPGQWWYAQMASRTVTAIDVYLRTDYCGTRNDVTLYLLSNGSWVYGGSTNGSVCQYSPVTFTGYWPIVEAVYLLSSSSEGYMSLAEVMAYGP